jgi:Nif-specific regulatory protein
MRNRDRIELDNAPLSTQRKLTSVQFNELASLVATISEPDELVDRILRFVKRQLVADRVALFAYDAQGEVELSGAIGVDNTEVEEIGEFSRSVIDEALESGGYLHIADAKNQSELANKPSVRKLNIRSVLAAPLMRQARIVGVLYADTLEVPGAFVDGDRELINGLAHLLASTLEKAHDFQMVRFKSGEPRNPGSRRLHFNGVVGDSRRMQKIFRLAMAAARTEKSVIITGEPGTGKEVIADIVQQHGPRARMNYLKLNCAAVPEHNLEAELFGVAAGAFTGVMAREGVFELASGGTLFLDEIGELSLSSQSKLLRVLEDKYIRRVGGKRLIAIDVRILAATNTDLEKAVAEGRFRQDLFDRLNQFAIHLPPLRERPDDIRALAYHFLAREKDLEGQGRNLAIYPPVLDWLEDSPLPGNARELANVIGKMAAIDSDGILSWDDLPPDVKAQRSLQSPKFDHGSSFDNMMAIAESSILRRALDNADGRIRKAARSLEMPEATLRRRLKMLDLHHPTKFQMRRTFRPRSERRSAQ